MKKDKHYETIMRQVKMERAARREAAIEFKIPVVHHTVTKNRKKEQNRNSCRNFKF